MLDRLADHMGLIRGSGLFDAEWYCRRYPDAAALAGDPLDHYLRFGLALNRSPGSGFDADFYSRSNRDAPLPSLIHYLEIGKEQGMSPVPPPELSPSPASSMRAGLISAKLVDFVLEVSFWTTGFATPTLFAGNRSSVATVADTTAWHPPTARTFAARLAVSDLDLEGGLHIDVGGISFYFVVPSALIDPPSPPARFAGADATVVGRVDHAGRRMASGWALVPKRDERVELLLSVDGQPHALATTGLPRPDIAKRRGGDGLSGFRFDLVPNLAPCAEIAIEVRPVVAASVLTPAHRTIRPSGHLFPLPARHLVPIQPAGWTDDPVSVVILNRDGEDLLSAMFASARETGDLDGCEWIVVDHRSQDGSAALCDTLRAEGVDIRLIRREGNFSFSESCNFGAAEARGSIIVFANNDLIFGSAFLPTLRRHFGDDRCGILGAKLKDRSASAHTPIQHLGVHISPNLSGDMIRPYEARVTGETPDLGAGAVLVPAVTGAFLALRRTTFDTLDGFDTGYVYGMEDADLCLRATARGIPVLCEHGFDIVHHRGATRDSTSSRKRREANYQRFNSVWGAALRSAVPDDTAFWTGTRPVLGVWESRRRPDDMHLRILPDPDVSGISHLGGPGPDPFSLSGTSPFLRYIDDCADTLRIAIKCPAEEADTARWGDYHFAQSLAEALGRLGHKVRVDCRERWAAPIADADDVVIVLRGLLPYRPKAHQINILWVISHPGDLPSDEVEGFDLVYSASEKHARALADLTGRTVTFLPQCTDTQRFSFQPDRIGKRGDRVLFVGNARGVYRDAVRWCADAGIDLHLYGKGWRPFPASEMVRGANIPNEVLADFYASSRIVLCDHWADMRRLGFVSNRVMDVLAVGGALAVDDVEGAADLIPGGYGIFRNAADLRMLTGREPDLSASGLRARERIARHVAENHSFDARAATLNDALLARLDRLQHRALLTGARTVAGLYPTSGMTHTCGVVK